MNLGKKLNTRNERKFIIKNGGRVWVVWQIQNVFFVCVLFFLESYQDIKHKYIVHYTFFCFTFCNDHNLRSIIKEKDEEFLLLRAKISDVLDGTIFVKGQNKLLRAFMCFYNFKCYCFLPFKHLYSISKNIEGGHSISLLQP